MILRVPGKFVAAVQITIFSKILDFIFGQKWPILVFKKVAIFGLFSLLKTSDTIKKDIEVDDTSDTGTVCPCRSDTNIFENLEKYVGQKRNILGQK